VTPTGLKNLTTGTWSTSRRRPLARRRPRSSWVRGSCCPPSVRRLIVGLGQKAELFRELS
jgi:hypothetical protein